MGRSCLNGAGPGTAPPVLWILRENDHCVRPNAYFAGAGQSIGSFLMGFDVRGGMIGKIGAVVVGVAVKARFPQSGPRKTDDITITVLIHHINYDNDAIGWTLFVPTMESDQLGPIVKMIDVDVLTAQPPRHARPVAPKGDQIPVHAENTVFVLGTRPVDRVFILEPAIFQQLLPLKKHRDAGRSKNKCSAQGGAFLGKPAIHLARSPPARGLDH